MHKITLRESPRRAICEITPRYDVLLNGARVSELSFNTRGYIGSLPLPGGRSLWLPESPISAIRREIATINREARST